MRLEKCWFCSSTVYPGHGIQFVRNDAKIFRFCRSKCHKNFKMKRNPRKVKWTKAYRRLHGKDMTQDSTFEFERKRNRPERYDRNLAENTLKAIKTIDKVRSARQDRHHDKRMKGKRIKEQKETKKELEQSIHMVKAPSVLVEEPSLTMPKIKVKASQQQLDENHAMEDYQETAIASFKCVAGEVLSTVSCKELTGLKVEAVSSENHVFGHDLKGSRRRISEVEKKESAKPKTDPLVSSPNFLPPFCSMQNLSPSLSRLVRKIQPYALVGRLIADESVKIRSRGHGIFQTTICLYRNEMKVLGTDDVSDEHLIDRRFVRVRLMINIFFVIKKQVVVSTDNEKELTVVLKYERLPDFLLWVWSIWSYEGDKRAKFISISEIINTSGGDFEEVGKGFTEETQLYGGRRQSRFSNVQNADPGSSGGPLYRHNLSNCQARAVMPNFNSIQARPLATHAYFGIDGPVMRFKEECVAEECDLRRAKDVIPRCDIGSRSSVQKLKTQCKKLSQGHLMDVEIEYAVEFFHMVEEPATICYLKALIKAHSLDIVFLSVTKQGIGTVQSASRICILQNFLVVEPCALTANSSFLAYVMVNANMEFCEALIDVAQGFDATLAEVLACLRAV
ncbi:hypothetical protein Ancab_011215 [Ancistrocladus abbreviatus]